MTINMPGPQILEWFLEFTPADTSDEMSDNAPTGQGDLNIVQFVEAIEKLAEPRKQGTPPLIS